jgi:hypothetical protein
MSLVAYDKATPAVVRLVDIIQAQIDPQNTKMDYSTEGAGKARAAERLRPAQK